MPARLAIALLVAAAVAAVAAAPARAACVSSTPASAVWEDVGDDGELSLAPEIKSVALALDGACRLDGAVAVGEDSTSLIEGDTVTVYLDTDGDAATGSPDWRGADRAVVQVGRSGDDPPPALLAWDAAAAAFAPAGELERPGPGAVSFRAPVDRLTDAATGATLRVRSVSSWEGLDDTYEDWAPEQAAESFALAAIWSSQTALPAPPPELPPTPPAVTPTPTPTPAPARTRRCPAASLRGLPLAAARRRLQGAGCRARVVYVRTRRHRAGRVFSARRDGRTVVLKVARRPRSTSTSGARR